MFYLSVCLILTEHDVPVRIAACPVQLHIAVCMRTFARLMQHQQRGFVCMEDSVLYKLSV